MKRCIKAHNVPAFGDIPVGSVWADDSPFITDEDCFAEADTPIEPDPVDPPKPTIKRATRPVKES